MTSEMGLSLAGTPARNAAFPCTRSALGQRTPSAPYPAYSIVHLLPLLPMRTRNAKLHGIFIPIANNDTLLSTERGVTRETLDASSCFSQPSCGLRVAAKLTDLLVLRNQLVPA